MNRSGSESRSSSSSASDGEADPEPKSPEHATTTARDDDEEEEDGKTRDDDERSNNSSRQSDGGNNTNPANDDDQQSRQSNADQQVSGSEGDNDNDDTGDEEEDGETGGGQRRRRKNKENGDENGQVAVELNHEDLSDVSDLDSSTSVAAEEDGEPERKSSKKSIRSSLHSNGTVEDNKSVDGVGVGEEDAADGGEVAGDDETAPAANHKDAVVDGGQKSPIVAPPVCDLRQKLNAKKKATEDSPTKRTTIDDDLKKTDEDELDFEAEDGECNDEPPEPKTVAVLADGKVSAFV